VQIWPQVKAENAHLSSVCELGAIVGGLWRDLDPTQKQEFNELYAKDKVSADFHCHCRRGFNVAYIRVGRFLPKLVRLFCQFLPF